MPRYVAFLRGVSPMNAKMPELKGCFESAGFADVKTVLASGNVVFSARAAAEAALERKAEAAIAKRIGRAFYTIVRPTSVLRRIIEADPYAAFRFPAKDRKSTRLNSSHLVISYAVFCLKKNNDNILAAASLHNGLVTPQRTVDHPDHGAAPSPRQTRRPGYGNVALSERAVGARRMAVDA